MKAAKEHKPQSSRVIQSKRLVDKCVIQKNGYLSENANPIQLVSYDFAKSTAENYGLSYDTMVLPAIETYLRKKTLVDKMPARTIESLSNEEYKFYLVSLLTEAENRMIKKITKGTWYRGIGFAHYSYPTFRNTGILCGEGFDDQYYWTMGSKSETRWLPGATSKEICTCGPFSQIKFLTKYYDIDGNKDVIGIIVKKELSDNTPALYIDDPTSECGVRGPLNVDLAYLVNIDGNLIEFSERDKLPSPIETQQR